MANDLVVKYGFYSYDDGIKICSGHKYTVSIQGSRIRLQTRKSTLNLALADITTINGSSRPATLKLCYDEIVTAMSPSDGNAPVNTVAPAISQLDGLAIGDELAISSNGTWTSDTPITNYEYRWTRNGGVIAGETNVNYFIQDADMDANLVCQVRAKDSDGWSTWVNSNSFLIPIYWGVTGGASVWGTSTNNVYA
jgi:hypothetical protein